MVTKKSTEIKVGIVSIIALLVFIIGMSFARGCNVNVSTHTLKLRFKNSSGLQVANPVVINGVKRGTVSSVKNDNGSVLIEANLDKVDDIKSDAIAKITILEITGGKKVEINPGKSNQVFDLSKEVPGISTMDLADMIVAAGDLSVLASSLLSRLDSLGERVNYMFNKGKLVEKVVNIANNADIVMNDARNLLQNNNENINATLKNIKYLTSELRTSYDKYEPRLDKILSSLETSLQQAKSTLSVADTGLKNLNFLLTDVRSMVTDIKTGNGLVSRLIYDKVLSSKVDSTLQNVDDLIQFIKLYGVNVNLRLGTRP